MQISKRYGHNLKTGLTEAAKQSDLKMASNVVNSATGRDNPSDLSISVFLFNERGLIKSPIEFRLCSHQ